jgi:insulysin
MTEALNVFAHFFIDPLLADSMVEKEVNAVNSEYEIDVSGDGWKLMHIITMLSDPSHPLSRFTIGNNQSLNKKDVVEALKDFHSHHYSANLMALVIKSPKGLDHMEQWVKSS